jgi:hypothetical protein
MRIGLLIDVEAKIFPGAKSVRQAPLQASSPRLRERLEWATIG